MKKKNKIIIWSIMAVLILALAGAGTLLFLNSRPTETVSEAYRGDVEWYDVETKEFVLDTVAELYEFSKLTEFYDFKGQTVKLGADLVLNEGKAADWAENAPENRWQPIEGFAGTFDGQGHSISGMYVRGINGSAGMFTDTGRQCVLKNFRLLNSYICGFSNGGTGSIIGKGSAKLDTIYTDAIVIGSRNNIGGMIGKAEGSGDVKFSNCWFDGKVELKTDHGYYGGGFIGVATAQVTLEHCLNTGEVTIERPSGGMYIGGMCGSFQNGKSHKISDCLNVGNVESKTTAKTYMGAIFGRVEGTADVYFDDVYASYQSCDNGVGSVKDTSDAYGYCGLVQDKSLIGFEGYRWTTLDFEKYWTVVEDGTPILQVFAEKSISIPSGFTKAFSVDWYDKSAAFSTINTKEDLYGFYLLASGSTFEDQVVKLGADIVLNQGNAKDWKEKAPENLWMPITKFAGTFDGQGHTISGLYIKTDAKRIGLFSQTTATSVVKNLQIKNSYIESTNLSSGGDGYALVGTIAGTGRGVFDTIYSDAILVCDGQGCGGITGYAASADISQFKNCWFNGSIQLLGAMGRCGGGIIGYAKSNLTMEHCLNTGSVITEVAKGAAYIGGLSGYMTAGYEYNISDCLTTGRIETPPTKTYYGAFCGRVDKKSTLNLKNVYATKESCKSFPGSITDDVVKSGEILKISEDKIVGIDGYQWTTLDFANYWVAVANQTPQLKSFTKNALSTASAKQMVAVDWYDQKTNVIDSVADLYGFQLISQVKNFTGETIYLGADIRLNEGTPYGADGKEDAEDKAIKDDWSYVAPANVWTPIGKFAGTFDGKNHTIYGMYIKTATKKAGLFAETVSDTIIKNLSVKDSYLESTVGVAGGSNAAMGSIVGVGKGKFSTIYSNAIIVSDASCCGGIVGQVISTEKSEFSNCWFDGSISLSGTYGYKGGGIIGSASDSTTLLHCLNTGTISTSLQKGGAYIGGLCGVMTGGKEFTINDSLNAGKVETPKTKTYFGSIYGRVEKKSTINMTNVYATSEACNVMPGGINDSTLTGNSVKIQKAKITGYDGYRWTSLNFKNYWTVDLEGTPVLKSFVPQVEIPENVKAMVTVSWYDSGREENKIDSLKDLYGFWLLSSTGYDFAGQKIVVGKDIVVNEGTPFGANNVVDTAEQEQKDDWKYVAPEYHWTPISSFAGTLDGKGHSISGLYLKTTSRYAGLFAETTVTSQIKNLKVINSYFESSNTMLGAIAGRGRGNFEKIYVDALVYSTAGYCGGLIGQLPSASDEDGKQITYKVSECRFGGEVNLTGCVFGGGLIGEIRGKVDMKHCLNEGMISVKDASEEPGVGGLIGQLKLTTATVSMEDCLNTGSVTASGTHKDYIGSLIGCLTTNTDATIENSYVTLQSCSAAIGNDEAATFVNGGAIVVDEAKIQSYGGYEWTTLNFEDYWAVKEGGTPILKHFASKVPSLEGKTQKVNISWYNEADPEDHEHTIDSLEDFYGFYYLAATRNFAGQKISLGADIIFNEGTPLGADQTVDVADEQNKDDWKYVAPARVWTPIAGFAGEFNGADPETGKIHKISGLYVKSSSQNLGFFASTTATARIQNLRVVDSYFESTRTNTQEANIGSIVGYGNGLFNKVYSNSYVVSSGKNAGGLVGFLENANAIFTDCWNAGTVTLTGEAVQLGGLVGLIESGNVEFVDCLNSGAVKMDLASGNAYEGGLIGRISRVSSAVGNATVSLTDCLNVGATEKGGSVSYSCAIVGYSKYAKLTITDVYSDKELNGAALRMSRDSNSELNGKKGGTYSNNAAVEAVVNEMTTEQLQGADALKSGNASGLSVTHWITTTGYPELACFQEQYLYKK